MLRIITIFILMLMLVACGTASDTESAATEEQVAEIVTTVEPVSEDASDPAETVEPEAQSGEPDTSDEQVTDETTDYAYELTETHILDMTWGGQASFNYPEGWRVVAGDSDVTIYGDDRYTISFSVNNNPSNTAREARGLLDRLNQSEEIITVEQDEYELLHTRTLAGNAITGGIVIDENVFAIAQMVNTRGRDLDPMLATMLDILASVELVEEAE